MATYPSLTSTPTTILPPYFATTASRKSLSFTAAVPRTTASMPASMYRSTTSMLLIPPPISQGHPPALLMSMTVSKLGVSPSLAPSRSTIWISWAPQAAKSSAISAGLSLYTVMSSYLPLRSLTALPPIKSIAGSIIIISVPPFQVCFSPSIIRRRL